MEAKKQIEIIKEQCKKERINIYELFRKAQVPVSTIQNWERKDPGAFETKNKLDNALAEMIEQKHCITIDINSTSYMPEDMKILSVTATPIRE